MARPIRIHITLVALLGAWLPVQAGVNSWTAVGSGPYGGRIDLIFSDPGASILYVSSRENGIFRSLDGGDNWSPYAGPPEDFPRDLYALLRHEDQVYWGGTGAYVSAGGPNATWTAATPGFACLTVGAPRPTNVGAFVVVGSTLFAGTFGSGVFTSPATGTPVWTAASDGLPFTSGPNGSNCAPDVTRFAVDGNRLYAATSRGVFVTPLDGPTQWTEQSSGLPTGLNSRAVGGIVLQDGNLLAIAARPFPSLTGSDLSRSPAGGPLAWSPVTIAAANAPSVNELIVHDGAVFIGTDEGVLTSPTGASDTWTAVNAGLTGFTGAPLPVHSLAVNTTHLLAGTSQGVYRSPAAGPIEWEAASTGLQVQATVIAATADRLLLGTRDGVYTSPLGGPFVWRATNDGLPDFNVGNNRVVTVIGDDDGIHHAALELSSPIFRRPADGLAAWSGVGILDGGRIRDIASIGSAQFIATDAGMYVSADGEPAVDAGGPSFGALATNGIRLFGANSSGVSVTASGLPLNWTAFNVGLPVPGIYVDALAIHGDTLYAGTEAGVYAGPASGPADWQFENDGLVDDDGAPLQVFDLAVTDLELFALTSAGVYVATIDDDLDWTPVNNGISALTGTAMFPRDLAGHDGKAYAATPSGVFELEYEAPASNGNQGSGGGAVSVYGVATLLALGLLRRKLKSRRDVPAWR